LYILYFYLPYTYEYTLLRFIYRRHADAIIYLVGREFWKFSVYFRLYLRVSIFRFIKPGRYSDIFRYYLTPTVNKLVRA